MTIKQSYLIGHTRISNKATNLEGRIVEACDVRGGKARLLGDVERILKWRECSGGCVNVLDTSLGRMRAERGAVDMNSQECTDRPLVIETHRRNVLLSCVH